MRSNNTSKEKDYQARRWRRQRSASVWKLRTFGLLTNMTKQKLFIVYIKLSLYILRLFFDCLFYFFYMSSIYSLGNIISYRSSFCEAPLYNS